MRLVGVTGGIGMGKSTSGRLLQERGVPVIDTDILARQIVEPGQPALGEIREEFGPELVGPDGRLRRGDLAQRVFSNPAARRKLEEILHPRIRQLWQTQVETWRSEGCPVAAVIIPLLFETDAGPHFDSIICVACSVPSQRDRLRGRGWNEEQVRQRLEAQWPVERKLAQSDFVVWTEGAMETHAQQLRRIIP